MKLIFKQKMFSFFDSYNIYNENGKIMFTVKSQFYLFGKHFYVYDKVGQIVGRLKQKAFTYLPVFDIYLCGENFFGKKLFPTPLSKTFWKKSKNVLLSLFFCCNFRSIVI